MTFDTLLARARSEGRTLLNEVEAKEALAAAGVPVTPTVLATSPDEAQREAERLGYPVALKVVSAGIAHKSDVGGVELGLADAAEVAAAYDRILENARRAEPGATIDGVSVQPMARPGTEVIIGVTTDPQFGPVLMFGLGGIMVEVLQDVAFRIIPIEPRDADEMLGEIRAAPVLQGVRGQPPADLGALRDALLAVSRFVESHPEVRELDLNPTFAYPDGALAVDARIVVAEGE